MVKKNWNFHILTSEPSDGSHYHNSNGASSTTCVVTVDDVEALAYTLAFEAKGLIGDWCGIYAWDESNKALLKQVNESNGRMFTLDLTGKDDFRVRVISVDGEISVSGKIVE